MNNQLFSTIVTSLTNLNDAQGAQILSIVNGLQNVATPSATVVVEPKKVSAKKEFKGTAKDVTISMKATKNVVTIDGYVGKDTWTVLKRRFEALGGTYDKTSKSITFKTQKDAKEFATNTVVTASERENIWKEWKAR